MRKSFITVYDLDMRKVAMLENAATINYETPMNALWTAGFELPLNDPKNEYCNPFYYVELFDADGRLDLYRILPNTAQRSEQTQKIVYKCEHVLATLLDDIMFQYHTVGNLGVYTTDSINYILQRQTTKRWKLGTVDFARQFEYNWENTNLLSALYSVPKPFSDQYMWTWDTTSYPWTLNLVRPSDDVQAVIRYGHNMTGITRHIDPTNLVNRIYALGYGEGVNQLTFSEINGGLPYIDNAASIAKYGVKQTVWVDRRFTSAETLLGRAEAILAESSEPRTSYTVDASELYTITKDPIDKFKTGAVVRVQDPDLGDHFIRVVNVKKGNVRGAPGAVQLEIANRTQNIATAMSDLQNRMRIEEVYAQGATNFDSHDFADNCDPTHPAIMKFWIPEETVRINKVELSLKTEAFRAYSRSIESAPATSSGPSSSNTTEVAPAISSGPSSISTTASGGGVVNSQGGPQIWDIDGSYGIGEVMQMEGGHAHTIVVDGIPYTTSYETGHRHGLVSHYHTITLPSHTHDMPHTHIVPAHTHAMPHTHQIPAHTHGIEHGIFEGPTPTSVIVKVDGVIVSGIGANDDGVDIVPYLAKDDEGKITRGAWHTIEVVPNSLGRIVANVFTQLFAQSRGGGDF